jgi:ubiquinone/menaquinone biosynthesis C-methylase UbiE
VTGENGQGDSEKAPEDIGKEEKATSGYYREEFGRVARFYDMGLRAAFHLVGGEVAFRCKIVEMANVRAGNNVLDVSCGTGTLVSLLASCAGPDGHVVGIDLSEQMLEVAKSKVWADQVEFVRGNAEDIPFQDSFFDRVTMSLAIHEMNRKGRNNTLAQIWRVLKPGGLVVVADMRKPDTLLTKLGMRFVQLAEADSLADMWQHKLVREIDDAGFVDIRRHIAGRGFFEVIVARKRD